MKTRGNEGWVRKGEKALSSSASAENVIGRNQELRLELENEILAKGGGWKVVDPTPDAQGVEIKT